MKDFEDYFGNRGIEFNKKYIKKIRNDGKYIYWIPNKKYTDNFFSSEFPSTKLVEGKRVSTPDTVLWVKLHCMYAEIEDEVTIDKSPFSFDKP